MTRRSLLATRLLDFLEVERIDYVLVGDVRQFPHQIPGDIDIVVDPDVIPRIPKVLAKFCITHRSRIVQMLQHEQNAYYYTLAISAHDLAVDFLHPDICGDFIRRGRLLLKAKDILARRVRIFATKADNFSFFVPDPPLAFIYYLVKKIDKGDLREHHGEYLSFLWQKDPQGARRQLGRFWSVREIETLIDAAEKNRWGDIRKELSILQYGLRSGLSFTPRHYCLELFRRLRRTLNPTGLHVVFLGPDGAGKSTVLRKIEQNLAPAFRLTKRYHLRPFFGRPSDSDIPNPNPHGRPLRDMFSSFVKLAVWWLDFTIGYCVDVFPRLVSSTFVLFDRYYCDLSVDHQRYRYGGPTWLVTLVGKLIPSPNIVILLQAPVEVIRARKQEVPDAEIARQIALYKRALRRMPNGYVVDSSRPLGEVVSAVEEIILAYMSARAEKRLRLSGDNLGN
jgi:thymidylate kinase